jgi:hypothetical protein
MSMHPQRNYFAEFKKDTRVFVETGSFNGAGIQLALDAGFEKIISFDIDPANIEFCKSRFPIEQRTGRIYLHQGDTAECLWDCIQHIEEPILFWLDAHWQMLEGTEPGKNPFPLLKELHQISKHRFTNDHTVIIDDMLIMQWDIVGYSKAEIELHLEMIFPNHKLDYFANPVINNILVAHV